MSSGDTPDKVQLNARISPETKEKLHRYIARNYGKAYGALGEVVDEAILRYIEVNPSPNTHGHKTRPPRGHNKGMKVLHHLKGKGYSLSFSRHDFLSAIKAEIGFDYRTVRKWQRWLVEEKYVKMKGMGQVYFYGPMSGFETEDEDIK